MRASRSRRLARVLATAAVVGLVTAAPAAPTAPTAPTASTGTPAAVSGLPAAETSGAEVEAAPAATPAPGVPVQADPGGVSLQARSQTSWVTREGTWSLTVAVRGAPPGSRLTADLYARVADRDQYARSVFGVLDGDPLPPFPDVDLDTAAVGPDGSRTVTLAVTLRADAPADGAPAGWRFFSDGLRPGVYPVDINVVDDDDTSLTRVVTHITRVPSDGDPEPSDADVLVAPLVSVGSGPTVGPDRRATPDPGVARTADDLAEGLALAPDLPLTLVPRPESVEALAREEGSAASLTALQRVARGRQVVDGTYVEVPLGAWVERGLTDELSRQRDRGNGILTEQLGRADSSTWDARAGLTAAGAAALWPVGVRTVILAPGALEGAPTSGPVTIPAGPGRTLEAVVPDADISGALARDGDDPVLNAAALAAELALLAAATDGTQGVVLAPPEGWLDEVTNLALVGQVLQDPAAPVEPVGLAELLDRVPDRASRQLRPALQEDLGGYPERLGLARARLGSYASLVGPDSGEVGSLDQLLLLSGSTALTPTERAAYVEEVLAVTERRFQAVRGPDGAQTATLTSSDGEIPLTLRNDLERPVEVAVEVPSNGRVDIGGFVPTQTLDPGTNRLEIPVHARAPGDTTLEITVRTTDGAVDLDEVRYTVRSTAVPGIGVVLSAGAVAFLLVWWARHWLRDRRARGGGGRGGGDGGDPDGPEPGPDPAPATTAPTPPELVAT